MATATPGRKRIIVCCDGTWLDADGEYHTPSNVTRIARAIKPIGHDKHGNFIPQVVFYQNGVGTGSNSLYVKYVGGAVGGGLAEHIREAYSFICQNYVDGDEIFIIGFSRGAFTARSISSLIRAIGLLTPKGDEYFYSIFEDWQYQLKEDYKTQYPDHPWPGHKPPVHDAAYQRKMLELELTRPNIPIKAVAVWDTVGGLGIPMIGLLPQPPSTEFSFVDTKVEKNIEYAFQALALDEHRRAYQPTIWEKPEGQELPRILKQCWFPGVHSDIGGSYADTDLANLTLCWMVSQLSPLIDFEYVYIWTQIRLAIEQHETEVLLANSNHTTNGNGIARKSSTTSSRTNPPRMPTFHTPNGAFPTTIRPWGLGKIHDSMSFFFRLGGSKIRTPGEYTETERAHQHGSLWFMARKISYRLHLFNIKPMPRLQNTHETFHSSVRIRMGKRGKGYNDKGFYDSEALQGWVMSGDAADPKTPHQLTMPGTAGAMKNVKWHKRVTKRNERGEEEEIETLEIPEDDMGEFEKRILRLWPEISDEFDVITPGGHRREITMLGEAGQRRRLTFPPRVDGRVSNPMAEGIPPLPRIEHHVDPLESGDVGHHHDNNGTSEAGLHAHAHGKRPEAARRLSLDTRTAAAATARSRGNSIIGEGEDLVQVVDRPPDRADTA